MSNILENWPLLFGNKTKITYNQKIIEIIYHGIINDTHVFSIDGVEIFIPTKMSVVAIYSDAGVINFTINQSDSSVNQNTSITIQ